MVERHRNPGLSDLNLPTVRSSVTLLWLLSPGQALPSGPTCTNSSVSFQLGCFGQMPELTECPRLPPETFIELITWTEWLEPFSFQASEPLETWKNSEGQRTTFQQRGSGMQARKLHWKQFTRWEYCNCKQNTSNDTNTNQAFAQICVF